MTYIDKNGKLQYCSSDSKRRCIDFNSTCDKTSGSMACNTPWWRGGYWYGWWGWNPFWDVYGDNLTYLYSEIDGPDWVFCGDSWYGWWWYGGGSQDCNLSGSDCANVENSNCGRPRIKSCKRYNCINNNTINDCDIINGKDREVRCCKKPSDYYCEQGQCDYEYSIVKKEYTVDYERVSGGGVCVDNAGLYESYPETSCYAGANIVDSICVESVYGCTPEDPCDPNKCVAPTKDGWEQVGDEPGHSYSYYWYDYWWWGGIVWEYDKIDCDCKTCSTCADCEEYPCNSYYGSSYYPGGWGLWGYYYGGIGNDCCGSPPSLCPKQQGDGSNNPWWCSGSSCLQETNEVGKAYGYEGPYYSYTSCVQKCETVTDENNCIQPDYTYDRGLCCDKKFLEERRKKIDDGECLDSGPSYTEDKIETLCTDSLGCGGNAVYNYAKPMCTFIPKYCKTKKVDRQRGYFTFTYAPEIPDKDYECNCISCDANKDTLENCKSQECYQCPKGSQKPIVQRNRTPIIGGGDVTDEATVKLVVVYCKIVTTPCPPPEEESTSEGE